MSAEQNTLTPNLEPLLEDASFLLDLETSVASQEEKKQTEVVETESIAFSDADLDEVLENQGTLVKDKTKKPQEKEQLEEAVQTSQSLWQTPKKSTTKDSTELYQKFCDMINSNISPLYDQLREIREDIKNLRDDKEFEKVAKVMETPLEEPKAGLGGMLTPDIININRIVETPKLEKKRTAAYMNNQDLLEDEKTIQHLLNAKELTQELSDIRNNTQEILEIGKATQEALSIRTDQLYPETSTFMTAGNKKIHINEKNLRRASALFADLENSESNDDSKVDSKLEMILAKKPVNKFGTKKQFKVPSAVVKKESVKKAKISVVQELDSNSPEDKPTDKSPIISKPIDKLKSHATGRNEERKAKKAGTGCKRNNFVTSIVNSKRNTCTQETHKAKRTYKMSETTESNKAAKVSESSPNIVINQRVFHWLQEILNKCKDGLITPLKLSNTPITFTFTKELIEFECPCTSIGQCTVCQGRKKIGVKEFHAFLFVSVKTDIPLHWIQTNYKLIQWKLLLHSQIITKQLFNVENFLCQLWKRYNNEYIFKKYSFLYKVIIENVIPMQSHCVLLIFDVLYDKAKNMYELELSDSHHSILTTEIEENDPLHGLIRKKLLIGDKIHSIGAELVPSKKLTNELLSGWRIKLYYNQIAKALPISLLGLHKKGYLYKSVTSLSPYGGPIFMLDVNIVKIIKEEITILEAIDYLNKDGVKINIRNDLKEIEKVKEGMRIKVFNVIGIRKESDILEVENCEKTWIALHDS